MEELFRPTLQPFLDTTTPYGEARIAITGAPLDLTGSYRRGTRFAPEAIRQASQYMDTYSPRTGLDLDDLSFADLGNLKLSEDVEASLSVIEEAVRSIHDSGKSPVLLGGEHTATLGALRALKPDLVVGFDAHLDLRDRLMGLELSHATFMRRAMEEFDFRLVVLGSRALSREELDFVEENPDRISLVNSAELREGVEPSLKAARGWLEDASSVYLSIDMDVLDPAVAPAVGNPSPEGIDVTQLLDALSLLVDERLLGFDLTEVSPHYDSGLTATQASYIVLETMYLMEGSRRS
jgi:agmatinase